MTNNRTPLDIIALQRHMLSQMGLTLWVKKNQTISNYKPPPSRFGKQQSHPEPLSQQIPSQQIPNNRHLLTKSIHSDDKNKQNNAPNAMLANLDKNDYKAECELPIVFEGISVQAAVAHYELLAVFYNGYLLLADRSNMSDGDYALWERMVDALKKSHATKSPSTNPQIPNNLPSKPLIEKRIIYPDIISGRPDYDKLFQGTSVLFGGLLAMHYFEKNTQVIALTPITEGINIAKITPTEFSLEALSDNKSLKKRLWDRLLAG